MKIRTGIESGRGLGDAIADISHLIGADKIAKVYERVTGKDCGCEQRQQTLNQLLPIGGKQA